MIPKETLLSNMSQFETLQYQDSINTTIHFAFRGADRLYVTRLAEARRYWIIGDAYVDGLTQDEAYEGVDGDEIEYNI
jgi:hypothetical protein